MLPKELFFDNGGRALTNALFLESTYDTKYAQYTLKEYDYEYEGKKYPSLKRLYLECEDPTEYSFVQKHMGSWSQWQRICNNKTLRPYIEDWREELEVRLRSQAIKNMIEMACSEDGNFSAAKYLAEYGWEKRKAGRPTKDEVKRHLAAEEKIANEFSADIRRMDDYRK